MKKNRGILNIFVAGAVLLLTLITGLFLNSNVSQNQNLGGGSGTINPLPIKSFLGLNDTPDSYSGQGSKIVSVKSDASGLEFTAPASSMVYPGAGIPLSTGSAWDTSITNNSANWNTAYGWGNHASAGYLTSLSGALLATGATTGATSSAQPFTLGVKTGKIFPASDSTTALQFLKADGTTSVLNVDTTNGRVGIGTTTPTSLFSVGSSSQFQVNSSGNIVSLNGVTTSFPASNASGVLTNDGSGTLTWAAGGGGITNSAGANVLTKSDGTNIVATALNEASAGVFSTTAGTAALSFVSTAPTATTGASQVGIPLTLTASPAVASTDTAGAAAGGDVTITAGDAARLTSGNAAGGNINLTTGTAIGTGYAGRLIITQGAYSQSIMLSSGGIYFGSSQGNHPPTGDSIGIGLNSMYGSVTGTKNIAIGTSSLRSVTSGAANTAIGFATGYGNAAYDDTNGLASAGIVTGSNNTLFGSYTNTALTSITNSTAIGYKSRISASNSVVLGNKEVTLLQLGSDSSDTQTARVIRAAGARGGTDTNTAGSPLTISGGVGTGTATSAPIYFATGDVGASGTTAQTVTTKMTLTGAGNLGIGTTSPSQKLEINGGMRLNTATAKPTCDSTTRGTFWYTQGGAGVKDAVEVCAKDAADAYAWRTIY